MKVIVFVLINLMIFCAKAQEPYYFLPTHKYKAIEQNNELERNQEGKEEPIYANPVMLDGKPIDLNNLNLKSKGKITIVKGDPKTSKDTIAFTVNLRRNGEILNLCNVNFYQKSISEIDIEKVLTFALPDDRLIFRPVLAKNYKAKRIYRLIN